MKNPNSPWNFLFFPFIIGLLVLCLYFIYLSNPYLMAQEALYDQLKLKRGADATLVRSERPDEKIDGQFFAPAAVPLKNQQRTLQWPETLRPSHRLERFDEVKIPGYVAGESQLQIDGSGAYLSQAKNFVVYDTARNATWTFNAPESDQFLPGPAAVGEKVVYIATEKGRLYCLDKATGRLIWYRASENAQFRQPMLSKHYLSFFVKGKTEDKWDFLLLEPATGKLKKTISSIIGQPSGYVAFNDEETMAAFGTESSHLVAVHLTNGEVLWKSDSPAPFKGSPAIIGDRVYAANEAGVLFAHDMKSGREVWELDLSSKFASPVSVLAEVFTGYLVDRNGYIHSVNLRGSGKREWRYNLNQTNSPEVMIMRMRGSSFAELKVEPKTRMWTLWSFCSSSRLCIFEPKEGQLLHRIELKGRAVGQPYFDPEGEDMWVGLTDNWGDSGDEAKGLKLVHFMDAKKAKALREAQKSSPLGVPAAEGN